jgi:hypothetical protein
MSEEEEDSDDDEEERPKVHKKHSSLYKKEK